MTKELIWDDPVTLDKLTKLMEEMANTPKEEVGERQPGERQASEIYAEKDN